MKSASSTWRGHFLVLTQWFSIRLARRKGLELREYMTDQQWGDLLAKADAYSASIASDSVHDTKIREFLYSSQSMLCHPMLVHYIRPAKRLAAAAGYAGDGIPVITNPNLTFGGRAFELERSALKVAEIPLGLVFLFRELGRGILSLHNAIENSETQNVPMYARACSLLSTLIYKSALVVYPMGEAIFKGMPFKNSVYAAHMAHILGVFVILHEMGHICKDHNLMPLSEEESKAQEHEADIFAMECLFAPKKNRPAFASYRKIQMACVCHLFSLMDLHAETSGANLYGYPSFNERKRKLLNHFAMTDGVSDAVRRSVETFEREVWIAPPPPMLQFPEPYSA